MAAKNAALSEAIAEAVYDINPELILFGLSGSELVKAGEKLGLRTANEVFSDRTYQPDGTLTPRTQPNALITDTGTAINQVIRMVKEQKVATVEEQDIAIQAETICIHGDGVTALDFAEAISKSLKDAGIGVMKVEDFL